MLQIDLILIHNMSEAW